jgi:hypothetical protein
LMILINRAIKFVCIKERERFSSLPIGPTLTLRTRFRNGAKTKKSGKMLVMGNYLVPILTFSIAMNGKLLPDLMKTLV